MMKRVIILFLALILMIPTANAAQEGMFTILAIYQEEAEQCQEYLDAAKENKYKVMEWSSTNGSQTITVDAPVIQNGEFCYSILPNGTATITGVNASKKVIEIPSEIDGWVVTEIGGRNTTGTIRNSPLIFDSPVEKIIVPDTVVSIGPYFVRKCYEVKEILLPETLQILSDESFEIDYSKIEKFQLPAGLKYLGSYAMGWRSDKEKLVLPSGLVGIGDMTYWLCHTYREVVVPGSLRYFGKEVFSGCRELRTLTLEEGLETLGVSMFANCENLSQVTIPASMKRVSDFAFDKCVRLSSLSFADGSMLREIGQGAFSGCEKLKTVNLPVGLEIIEGEAFYGCTNLASVVIPGSVTEIGDYAFEGCSSKLKLTVVEGSPAHHWAEENGLPTKLVPAPVKVDAS